ncbi:MAG: hypothetical protein E7666_00920 [Ruminococcaceae bacterium]|nr:hypothetical protein [Oscillospiraceae bacterium]
MSQASFPNIEGDSWEHLAFCTYTISEFLKNVGLEAREITYSKSPRVTRYRVTLQPPREKKKPPKASSLSSELALALHSAYPVRVSVEPNHPNTLLIDIPNENTEAVTFSDVRSLCRDTESERLPSLCIGIDTDGWPVQFRLDLQPHLLVSGISGSGKTSLINTFIAGLTSKLSPKDLCFLLFDPKKVEFSALKSFPYLLYPIISDPDEAISALQILCEEIKARCERLRAAHTVGIVTYRREAIGNNRLPPMPYVVVVIDEIMNLMLTSEMRKKATDALCYITQKGRAAGVHLIIGVQRPSPIILPELLLSNLPTRIALRTTTMIDSKMILFGHDGAQHLCGSGDALLLLSEDAQTPIRFQSAYTLPEDILSFV